MESEQIKISPIFKLPSLFAVLLGVSFSCGVAVEKDSSGYAPIYTYTLSQSGTAESYDEAITVACLQGIINRNAPTVYILSETNARPAYWLELLTSDGKWLNEREKKPLHDLDALMALADGRVKGAVIWDPDVPASMNVANTIAGIEDAIVFSPEFAEKYLKNWNLKVINDLRGMFTGKETGSKKNDAYRWAIREYLSKGLCSGHLVCLYEDPFSTREKGDVGYVVNRDWAIKNRSFVYDLSPWGDETPKDDPDQKLGTDLETYKMILGEILKQNAGNGVDQFSM